MKNMSGLHKQIQCGNTKNIINRLYPLLNTKIHSTLILLHTCIVGSMNNIFYNA